MTRINDFKPKQIIEHPTRGEGRVLKVTPRTITVKWKHSTQKISFKHNNAKLYTVSRRVWGYSVF